MAEIDRGQALRLLGSVPMGRIVFTRHAMPAIRPVNHVLDDGHILIRSHASATVVSAADNARGVVVAYQADHIDPVSQAGWSVVVTGTAHLVPDPGEVARYQQLLTSWLGGDMDQVIRIRPAMITGVRFRSQENGGAPGPLRPPA
jgi:nitroimidazol reductase NimA-like FMN-containing flavoprotein (pyridoxamine 5'-phosphate oxidase superfamily)